MIRATLDVNVLASGFPAETGVPVELILEGLARTWRKPYYQRRYSPDRVQQTLSLLRAEATLVLPVSTVHGVAADEEDDLVLATAIAGDAGFLVTGDRHLQALGHYEPVVILSPRQFLEILADESGRET